MNVEFVAFDPATGVIRAAISSPADDVESCLESWELWLPGLYSAALYYVDDLGDGADPRYVVRARGPIGTAFDTLSIDADGIDAATISDLPAGTLVGVNGAWTTIDDGELVITATEPSRIIVEMSFPPPYAPFTQTIEAT